MAIPDAAFSALQFCSYTVRRAQYTIGYLSDSHMYFIIIIIIICTLLVAIFRYHARVQAAGQLYIRSKIC